MQYYNNDFDYSSGYYDGYSETEEERRRREKELADQAVQTQEITTYGDGTVEETTTREYAPAVQQMAVEPIQPVEPVQQMPVAQPVPQMQPVDPAALAQQQAAQVQQQPAAMAQPQAASPYDLTPAGTGVGFQPKLGFVSPPAGQAEQTKQYINNYQTAQDDPMKLLALRGDETAPTFIRERAGEQAFELMNKEVQQKTAEKQAQQLAQAAAQGDRKASNTIARELQSKEGSWLKMILLKFIDPKLAGDEAVKLGVGNRWVNTTDSEGNAALVQVNLRGLPLKGYSADGNEIAAKDLVRYTSGGAAAKGVTQGQEVYKDPSGGVKGGFVLETRPGRAPVFKEVGTGRPATAEESRALSKVGVSGTLDQQRAQQIQRQNIDLQKDWAQLQMKIQGAGPEAANRFLGEFNAKYQSKFPLQSLTGSVPQIDAATGQMTQAFTGATPQVATGGTAAMPPAMPPATGVTADQARRLDTDIDSLNREIARIPANDPRRQERLNILNSELSKAQQARAQIGTPSTAPAVAAVPAMTQSPADVVMGQDFTKGNQEQFIKYVAEEVQPKAEAGSQISRIRKEQTQGPDGILNNAELAGILQGQGGKGSEAANIMRDLITGNFKDEADLSRRVASLSLNQRQKDVLYRQIGLNLQVAPLTLKANAGPGAVSDAEQKANREANVDITRQPLYSGLSLLTRDQFQKDLNVAKNDLRSSRPDIRSTDQLNKAWSAEKKKAETAYDGIYRARAQYIAKYNPDGTNTRAVVDAFKYYPVPEWTGTGWDYKTEYAKKAARPSLDSFNR